MSWFKRLKEYEVDGTPTYGMNPEFSIKMHFAGHFENRPEKFYTGGGVACFDFVSPDTLSLPELRCMLKELGFTDPNELQKVVFYHKVSETGLNDGFRELQTDKDVTDIPDYLPLGKEKRADIYADMGEYVPMVVDDGGENDDGLFNVQVKEKSKDTRKPRVMSDNVNEDAGQDTDKSESDESYECESFSDSEYDSKDDDMYDENVDAGVEYTGVSTSAIDKGKGKGKGKKLEWDIGSCVRGNVDETDDDFDEGLNGYNSEDDDPARPKGRVFNPKVDMENPKFEMMMIFKDHKQFQEAVKRHSILGGRQISFTKQTRNKVKAVCKYPCRWKCFASKEQHNDQLMIKTLNADHDCTFHYANKFINSKWLANEYVGEWKDNANASAKSITTKVFADHTMNVSKYQVYRAKNRALMMINGSVEEQYGKLWDYGEELRRRNPGSTVQMKLVDGSVEKGEPMFERFYVCFKGLKEGFKHCRPILSMDGCFLKSQHGGVLLVASGIDPNNNWYPVSYAIVERETKETWHWFLKLVVEDLEIVRDNFGFTIMSDKQKGLIDAVQTLLPNCEHRFCVMHMHGNMRRAGFKGETYKDFLWKAAKATTVTRFEFWMEQIATHDINAYRWFDDKPYLHWSRAGFRTNCKCDILLNNLSESFNSYILQAREMPILSCLEAIRKQLMTRLEQNREIVARNWRGLLCPKIMKEVEKRKKLVKECIPTSSGGSKYEVSCMYGPQYSVNIKGRTCTCRKWDLSGIPCSHAMACMFLREEEAVQYVHECYRVSTYKNVYSYIINPMDGPEMWPHSGFTKVRPPLIKKKPGRPKKMRRKTNSEIHDAEPAEVAISMEDGTQKLKRRVYAKSLKCSVCKQVGHNKRTCPILKAQTEAGIDPPPTSQADEPPYASQADEPPPPPASQSQVEVQNQRKEISMKDGTALLSGFYDFMEDDNDFDLLDTLLSQKGHGEVTQSPIQQSFTTNTVPKKDTSHVIAQDSTEMSYKKVHKGEKPPPGVMEMVIPAGRQSTASNPSFSDIGTIEQASNASNAIKEDHILLKGGKTYVTFQGLNKKALVKKKK